MGNEDTKATSMEVVLFFVAGFEHTFAPWVRTNMILNYWRYLIMFLGKGVGGGGVKKEHRQEMA